MTISSESKRAWKDEWAKIGIHSANVFAQVAIQAAFDEGYLFSEAGQGFERSNVACPRDILQEALQRMCFAINVDSSC